MTKKMISGLLVLFLLSMLVACAPESAAPASPSPVSNPAPTPGVFAAPSDTIYFDTVPDIVVQPGGNVEIQLTFTNYDSVPRVMRDFPPEITIELRNLPSMNNTIRSFPAGQEQLELQPGESEEYLLVWDQKDDRGQQVPYGWYGIRMMVLSREITDTRSNQGSGGQATRVLVLPPGGVMEKDIELDQSQVANGITVNLEKLEVDVDGAALYIMCVPENYKPQEESTRVTGIDAQYKVDDEDWKPAIKSEFGTFILEDGVRYIWNLDPMPKEADKLSFRINRMGDREGLWEFVIPLDDELPFRINVSTAPAHLPGERIMFGIGITNSSSGTITIDPFPPAMWIKPVGQDKAVYSSPTGTRTYDIQADQPFLPNKDTWDQKDNDGQQVAPGWYEIGYEYVIIEQSTGKRYTANPTARFQIVNPDSAMNKNLDLNQSVTVEGSKVTLESIEMNAVETKIYTFTTPPGYHLPPYEFESLMTNSMAEYSVDGGTIKQVKSGGGKADANGITLTWDNIEPMPVDAKEITFIITQLGDVKGRWEFKIQLE